ncbi:MAG: hypothetical protein M3460_25555 [Actinomycetota bacterium]|nr:hypothetical protein [Actinomycetota bacterium]
MTNIMFLVAGMLFIVGILIGAGLQFPSIDRRYRQVAQLMQELNEREKALTEQQKTLTTR